MWLSLKTLRVSLTIVVVVALAFVGGCFKYGEVLHQIRSASHWWGNEEWGKYSISCQCLAKDVFDSKEKNKVEKNIRKIIWK